MFGRPVDNGQAFCAGERTQPYDGRSPRRNRARTAKLEANS